MTTLIAYCDRDARWNGSAVDKGADTFIVLTYDKYSQMAMFHFPIASTVPAASDITAARFNYYVSARSGVAGTETGVLTELVGTWTESSGTPTAGAAHDALVQPLNGSTSLGWKYLTHAELLAMVRAWYDGTLTNNGLAFTGALAGSIDSGDTLTFSTRETAAVPNITMEVTLPTPGNPGAWVAPAGPIVRPGGAIVHLEWTASTSPGGHPVTYQLESRRVSDGSVAVVETALASPEYDWDSTGVDLGVYEFRVRASNGYNVSGYGPTSPTVRLVGGMQMLL